MVFSGNNAGDRQRRPATTAAEEKEEEMERLKPPIHNFDLPCLKWGNQKFLRCMKVDSDGDVDRKRKRSPDNDGGCGGGYGGVVIGERRKDVDAQRRFRSSDSKFSSSEKLKLKSKLNSISGEGEIEATREKLMFDLQTEVGKMKDAMLRGSYLNPSPSTEPTNSPATDNSPATETDRPWNLRTRRAACKPPPSNPNGHDLKPNSNNSPVRNEFEKSLQRPKFSVSLSRRQIEEDFTAICGRRLPRKPKKRPRAIQKQLDTLFPGLWLTEITPDLYKVPDETETGKR